MTEVEDYADGRLKFRYRDGVAAVTFNNPDRLNAMSYTMWQALGNIADRLATDDGVRVLTLEGAGNRAFVSGADISEFGENRSTPENTKRYGEAVARADISIGNLPFPTVALIRGYCIGGGLGIAMRCDLRLARDDAKFAITAVKLGLGYGFHGTRMLQRKLGHSVTADLLFTGRKLGAQEALAKGICDRVFEAETFETETKSVIAEIAANAPLTIRAAKASLLEMLKPEAEQDVAHINTLTANCFLSEDYQEGQKAFAEKRKPVFRGR